MGRYVGMQDGLVWSRVVMHCTERVAKKVSDQWPTCRPPILHRSVLQSIRAEKIIKRQVLIIWNQQGRIQDFLDIF